MKTADRIRALRKAIRQFFFSPATARPLAVLRIGVTAVLLVQAFSISGEVLDLYSGSGIIQGGLADTLRSSSIPELARFDRLLQYVGVSESRAVQAVFISYIAALSLLLMGLHTRFAAIMAWILNIVLSNKGFLSIYGVDQFTSIALFYFVWMPISDSISLDRYLKRNSRGATPFARLSIRVWQIHLCMIYFATGFGKAQGSQWWNGEAIWRALMLPTYNQFDFSWIALWPGLARLACWGTLLVELGYTFFIWPKRTRMLWVLATLCLHAGIGVTMGLVSFSAMMMVFTFSIFGISAEPDWARLAMPKRALAFQPR